MKLIVISEPLYFEGEALLINQLFEAGMRIFHWRKPGSGKLEYAALLAQIEERYHDRVALHQFHELLLDFPLVKRLHYPELRRRELLDKGEAFPFGGYILSTSIHHTDALQELTGFDYTFYGPVFNSLSKPGYLGIAGIGTADFTLPVKDSGPKCIALGGIDGEKVSKVKAMGFDGLAVLGMVWMDKKQALSRFKLIKDRCRSLK
jgi:thiamine-phosphate pyrophosphorylase